MTNPVLNLNARLVNKDGFLVDPWNSFFQQFTQTSPAVKDLVVGASPFNYMPNARGKLIVSGVITFAFLIRGKKTIALSNVTPLIVPMAIGDELRLNYAVAPTVQFLGD